MATTTPTAHPTRAHPWTAKLATARADLVACEQACLACADACLEEKEVEMLRRCIGLDLSCAAVCRVTLEILHRQSEVTSQMTRLQLRACLAACQECGEECERHASTHAHCRTCRDACLRCQESCNLLLGNLSPESALRER